MLIKENQIVEQEIPVEIVCDRCGRAARYDSGAADEYLRYSDVGGYHSRKDGFRKEIDLCEDCVYDVLGQWLRVTEV